MRSRARAGYGVEGAAEATFAGKKTRNVPRAAWAGALAAARRRGRRCGRRSHLPWRRVAALRRLRCPAPRASRGAPPAKVRRARKASNWRRARAGPWPRGGGHRRGCPRTSRCRAAGWNAKQQPAAAPAGPSPPLPAPPPPCPLRAACCAPPPGPRAGPTRKPGARRGAPARLRAAPRPWLAAAEGRWPRARPAPARCAECAASHSALSTRQAPLPSCNRGVPCLRVETPAARCPRCAQSEACAEGSPGGAGRWLLSRP
jgi:hypothetical protein